MSASNLSSTTPANGLSTPSSAAAKVANARTSKGLSCVLCQQRKVKCDRQEPCSTCTKSHAQCIYRPSAPPRRRKRREPEEGLRARLSRLEELLRAAGAKVDTIDAGRNASQGDSGRPEGSASKDTEEGVLDSLTGKIRRYSFQNDDGRDRGAMDQSVVPGRLIAGQGKSRYLESKLWANLDEEFRDTNDMLHSSSEDESVETSNQNGPAVLDGGDLIFGTRTTKNSLHALHPQPVSIFRLWQVFLDNINPLTKFIHAPTFQQLILEASGNLENIPKGLNALIFGIYLSSVMSLKNKDCEDMFGESKATLFTRYKYASEQALISAGFLKSTDLVVLQAYVLYLLAIRQTTDSRSLWSLAGIAVRTGQRMGIHRDSISHNLSVFEAEIRRRVWWQIAFFDGRAAEVCGLGMNMKTLWDTKPPLNLNDSEMSPDMTELPPENERPTEVMFLMLRSTLGRIFREMKSNKKIFESNWLLAEGTEMCDSLENLLQQKFLRYCDPLVPLHLFIGLMGRSVLCSWRVMAQTRLSPEQRAALTQEEKDTLFHHSLKSIEYDNHGHATPSLQRFMWHVNAHFQWHVFIYLLTQLKSRVTGEEVDRAWEQVDKVFEHHPEMINDSKNPLHIAIGNLTIAAWENRKSYLHAHAISLPGGPPRFISMIYQQQKTRSESKSKSPIADITGYASVADQKSSAPSTVYSPQSGANVPEQTTNDTELPFLSDPMVIDLNPIVWSEWDDLLQSYELPAVDSSELWMLDQNKFSA